MGVFDLFRQEEPDRIGRTGIENLIRDLQSNDPDRVKVATTSLQAFGKPALVPLLEKIRNADDALRLRILFVLHGLDNVTPSEICTCIKTSCRMEDTEIETLLSLPGRNALPWLLKIIADADSHVRLVAIGALAEIGEPGVPVLVKALSHRSHRIRAGAAEALVRQKWMPKNNDDYFHFLLAQEKWPDMIRAKKGAVPYLTEALSDRYYGIRMGAAKALGAIGDPRAISALGSLLADDENEVCISAIEALEQIHDEKAVRPLVDALSHKSYNVRHMAATALSFLNWTPDNSDEKARFCLASEQWHELTRMGKAAIPYLVDLLGNPRYTLRAGAASALKAMGTPGREALVAAAHSQDPVISNAALETLNESSGVRSQTTAPAVPDQHPTGAVSPKKPVAPLDPRAPHGKSPQLPSNNTHPAPEQKAGSQPAEPVVHPPPDPQPEEQPARKPREFVPPPLPDSADLSARERTPDFSGLAKEVSEPEISDEEIATLINTLQSGDENIRTLAVDALGRIGPRAIDALAGAIRDPSMEVRLAAADALGRIPDKRATTPLIEALQDSDEEVRAAAARSLGRIGDPDGFIPLISALTDPDASVRTSAEKALGSFGQMAAGPVQKLLSHTNPLVRGSAAAILVTIAGTAAIQDIEQLVSDPDTEVRERAVVALGSLGVPAIPALAFFLASADPAIRLLAVIGLGQVGPAAEEYLVAACRDKDAAVRERASTLHAVLRKKAEAEAALAPSECVIPSTSVSLPGPAGASTPTTEHETCRPVKSDGDTILFLIETLAHYSPQIQRSAAKSLITIGEPAIIPLINALASEKPQIRIPAARVLGSIGDTRAIPPLTALLDSTDTGMRRAVAEALGKIGDPGSIPDLIELLRDPSEEMRIAGARALGAIGHYEAITGLIEALCDEEYSVRAEVCDVMTRNGLIVIPSLVGALCHPSREIRRGAVSCLDTLGWEPDTIEELVYYQIACEAWVALSQAGDCALAPLHRLVLSSDEEDLRMGAVLTLVKMESPGAIDLLIEALRDKSLQVRRKAMNALVDRGESARDPLIAATTSSDPDIRSASAHVLERISRKSSA
ncbi:HEAT repeat domain-containing protein [Methanoregula sp.]|uniref:HEAT repeat domain-containing protein n=1 Tax=Methanoregula sp. TaxID=2052170 RepID=UPI002369913A|nr:HEAT repeat domain-containing protein [Methanoregula sp.]MDD1686639.1 HEAT repeat domain-containing protein [Methanoregula sp.]